jgi:thioredoxin reductase
MMCIAIIGAGPAGITTAIGLPILAAENILCGYKKHDLWEVNTDSETHQ